MRGLGLDAYLVGGAVRDELLGLESKDADFLVPGRRLRGLAQAARAARARRGPRGRGPAGRRAALPARPGAAPARAGRDRVRAAAAERSTGPGRHDFEIVADPALSIEDDMARRDFTVNAMARRLETDELVDPFNGSEDLEERRVLRTVRPRSFAEDPLRLVRGLRFVSQLGLEPDEETLEQMRDDAPSVGSSPASASAAGCARTGWASCRSSCSARAGEGAAARARHGRARRAPARVRAGDRFRAGQRTAAPAARRAHLRGRAGCGRRRRAARVRLAALFHDLGKPAA